MNKPKCFICGKELNVIHGDITIEDPAIDEGFSSEICVGYGSKFDFDQYRISFHDECFEKYKDNAFFIGNPLENRNVKSENKLRLMKPQKTKNY